MQAWIKENDVLGIVFRDNLHQTQYVDKLDRIVRFCIKEKVLDMEDLDMIWSCQDGKHEIIVKNVHDLLVKLAWDFSPEQLDHLFGCFQVYTWYTYPLYSVAFGSYRIALCLWEPVSYHWVILFDN